MIISHKELALKLNNPEHRLNQNNNINRNIFIDKENNIKIGDFGISRSIDPIQLKTTTFIGTTTYIAPEMLKNLDVTNNTSRYYYYFK